MNPLGNHLLLTPLTADTSDQHDTNTPLEQLRQFKEALILAIDENDALRERIIQLEALLAAAQDLLDDHQPPNPIFPHKKAMVEEREEESPREGGRVRRARSL